MQVVNLCVVGEGFIGSELVKELNQQQRIKIFHAPDTFKKPYGLSPREVGKLRNFFIENKINTIVNVAGPTDIQQSFVDTDTYIMGQIQQVKEHVQILKTLPSRCDYIYLSSGSVYGSTVFSGATENDIPNPLSPYAEGKLLSENYLLGAMKMENFANSLCILRGFSLYSHSKPNRLLSKICEIYAHKSNPELFGTGLETRDFVSVSLFASVLERIIFSSKRIDSGIFNLSSGVGLSIRDICTIAKCVSGLESGIEINFNGQVRKGDPANMVGVNTHLLNEFGLEREDPVSGITALLEKFLK